MGKETDDRTVVLTGSVSVYGQKNICMLELNADGDREATFFPLVFEIICHSLCQRKELKGSSLRICFQSIIINKTVWKFHLDFSNLFLPHFKSTVLLPVFLLSCIIMGILTGNCKAACETSLDSLFVSPNCRHAFKDFCPRNIPLNILT